jgi:hypothetical protein
VLSTAGLTASLKEATANPRGEDDEARPSVLSRGFGERTPAMQGTDHGRSNRSATVRLAENIVMMVIL